MDPGLEFKVAMEEAERLPAKLIYGDADQEHTMRRISQSFSMQVSSSSTLNTTCTSPHAGAPYNANGSQPPMDGKFWLSTMKRGGSCRMYGGCSWEGRKFLQMSRISSRVPGVLQAVLQDR